MKLESLAIIFDLAPGECQNGKAKYINCRGIGTCGTCAIKTNGKVSPLNWKEKTRLSLPPHSPENNLRLACQTKVFGNIRVEKGDGFWGVSGKT